MSGCGDQSGPTSALRANAKLSLSASVHLDTDRLTKWHRKSYRRWRAPVEHMPSMNDKEKRYTTKQMGDAGEMLVAAELNSRWPEYRL
jgi:hypothetical protein